MASDWDTNVVVPYKAMRMDANESAKAVRNFDQIRERIVGKQIFDDLRGVIGTVNGKLQRGGNLQGQLIVQNILMDMVNKETGQRGFLLTGQEASLEPYTEGEKAFVIHLNQLRSLVNRGQGSGVTIAEVNRIESLASDWATTAANPEIEARRLVNQAKADMDDVAALVGRGLGKEYMDGIRLNCLMPLRWNRS